MIALLAALAFAGPQSAVTVRVPEPGEYEAAVAATEPSAQGDWRVLVNEAGEMTAADVGNVQSDGATRLVWIARAGGEQVTPGSYAVFRLKVDCEAHTAQPVFLALRAANGANIIGQSMSEPARPYGPGSGGALVAAIVCEGQAPTGQSFPTHQAFAASAGAN